MPASTIDTIENLLESVLAMTDDSEVHFKVRTALSLLAVIKEREDIAQELLAEADIDEEVRNDLVELGYLE